MAGAGLTPGRAIVEMVTDSLKFRMLVISRSLSVALADPFIRPTSPLGVVTFAKVFIRSCSTRCWQTWLAELEFRAARRI